MLLPIVLAAVCLASSQVWAAYEKPYYEVEDAEYLFQEYVKKHNKVYNRREYFERLEIFTENLKKLNEKNARFPNTIFAVDHFADLKHHELKAYTGLKLPNKVLPHEKVNGTGIPDVLDWRQQNAVTGVKEQLGCGCCYIFSAVGNIEGQYALVHGQLLELSEQEGLACLDNGSCDGGYMDKYMQELIDKSYKLELEENYPYEAQKTTCRYDPSKGVVQLQAANAAQMNEEELKIKLANYGPLSIGVDTTDFRGYAGGILEPQDSSMRLDHAVLLVGYGEENGKPFWIIKNSWGPTWGEEGYIRVVRGVGACGIGQYVAYSTVA